MEQRDISVGGGRYEEHFFDRIISLENLFLAWREFRRGKTKKAETQQFEFNLEDNLFQLHRELLEKSYQPRPYKDFYVQDPKSRHIHKANIRDRVLHQAVFRVLYPIFDKEFVFDSYSCRFNKGVHAAVDRLSSFLRTTSGNGRRKVLVLKCDIEKFFDSIDQKVLLDLIKRKIKDSEVLWLVRKIIDSYENQAGLGLPLGNVTSQLFANIYLHQLDFFVKQRLRIQYYLRYCDDFIFICQEPDYLQLINQVSQFLSNQLGMKLHSRKIVISKYSQGIDFLGYVLRPHSRVLRIKTKRRLFKKIKKANSPSYFGVLSHCNGYKIKQKILDILKQ